MSDVQSQSQSESILSHLQEFYQRQSSDEISHLTISSTASSTLLENRYLQESQQVEKNRHQQTLHPVVEDHDYKSNNNVSKNKTSTNYDEKNNANSIRRQLRAEEIITPSRRRAQRNIQETVDQMEDIRWIPHYIKSFLFGLIYLIVGVIFYVYNADWSILNALYFISFSVCRIGLQDIAPQTDDVRLFTLFFVPCGVFFFWGYILMDLFIWIRSNLDTSLLSFFTSFSISHYKLSPQALGYSPIEFHNLHWTSRVFSFFFGPFCAIIFTFLIAILSTISIPPHLWNDFVHTEIQLPAAGGSNQSAPPPHPPDHPQEQQISLIDNFIQLSRAQRQCHPIAQVTISFFQNQLTETGYITRLSFLIGMLLEHIVEFRPDIQISTILLEYETLENHRRANLNFNSNSNSKKKGIVRNLQELQSLITSFEQSRIEIIRSFQNYLKFDSGLFLCKKILFFPIYCIGKIRPSAYRNTPTIEMQEQQQEVEEEEEKNEKNENKEEKMTQLNSHSKISNFKILSNCYTFMKESLQLNENKYLSKEKYLLSQYEKVSKNLQQVQTEQGFLDLIAIENNLALCYYDQRHYLQSEQMLRHCIELYHKSILHFTPRTRIQIQSSSIESIYCNSYCVEHNKKDYIYLLYNLANTLNQLQQFDEAEYLYLFCLSRMEDFYQNSTQIRNYDELLLYDPDYLCIQSNLAYLYSNHVEYHPLAEELYQQCLGKWRKILELISQDKMVFQKQLDSPDKHLSQPGKSPKIGEESLIQNEIYSFDNLDDLKIEQYQLLQRHYSILSLHSLFNLCCYYIERNIYHKVNVPELVQECLEKSIEIWGQNNDLVDRLDMLQKQMDSFHQNPKRSSLIPLWASLYSKSEVNSNENINKELSIEESFISSLLRRVWNGGHVQRQEESQRTRYDQDWGTIVMNPNEWLDSSMKLNTSSTSNRCQITQKYDDSKVSKI